MHTDSTSIERLTTLPSPTVKDRLAIHQTILRLTAVHKSVATAAVILVAVIWLTIINRILHFGRTLDYSGLEALGLDADLIKQYNPFFWWTVVIICTLFVTYFVFNFVQFTRHKASQKIVNESDLKVILNKTSPVCRFLTDDLLLLNNRLSVKTRPIYNTFLISVIGTQLISPTIPNK